MGHGGELVESSRRRGLRRRRLDDQTCSGNVAARRADGGWRSEDVDDRRCQMTACYSRPDIVEPCAACIGEQSLRACTGPAQERPASATRCEVNASNFLVWLTTRAAAFRTHWNLSVTTFGAFLTTATSRERQTVTVSRSA